MTEKKRIIRVMLAKIKPADHNLSKEEQEEFRRRDREKMEELGYKLHHMLDCSWSNDEWQFFAVEEWPSIEAIEKITKFHEEELGISRYIESKAYLGTLVIDEYDQE